MAALCLSFGGYVSCANAAIAANAHAVFSRRCELQQLLSVLPERLERSVQNHPQLEEIVEIVLDLGRRPIARFPSGDWSISQEPVTIADLEDAICMVGDFADDNRAGIDRTLHRISAIRNRGGRIVGLTCRVGRAVTGSAEMARDLVSSGASLLLMGPPGVGKTTAIREVARMLADDYDRRVVIVDTSNEIAGDGDIPHPGIGRARRMQVTNVGLQHKIMIEAVENHMPETIVIDEIGTELEAAAAVTIAQRGVQLVATAHGTSVENLIKNPSLEILVGGIQSVTLGDDEARRRGVQKSVLERKGPPAFSTAIEMASRTEWRIHHSLTATIDALLAGRSPSIEIRNMKDKEGTAPEELPVLNQIENEDKDFFKKLQDNGSEGKLFSLYPYQISEELLKQAIEVLELEETIGVASDIGAADAVLTLRSKLRENVWVRNIAKFRQLPVFAIKANTLAQMIRATRAVLEMEMLRGTSSSTRKSKVEDEIDALEEARLAIEQIVIAKGQAVELLPRSAGITALQIRLAESYQLASETSGIEPKVRLRILPLLQQGSRQSSSSNNTKEESSQGRVQGGANPVDNKLVACALSQRKDNQTASTFALELTAIPAVERNRVNDHLLRILEGILHLHKLMTNNVKTDNAKIYQRARGTRLPFLRGLNYIWYFISAGILHIQGRLVFVSVQSFPACDELWRINSRERRQAEAPPEPGLVHRFFPQKWESAKDLSHKLGHQAMPPSSK
ncbi:hypothetical protein SELMODRAFT_410877 [Selaginella moellendorffii]|uniref:AAA+ ATPase domain-containing protein n=1 Tax=Selaginella moellendorffii TaxID=88036 RepID=D8RG55_SELML|nr:hypothetical protein SELMODRAFT_410877 [Selaginella moellendorffii]